MEPILVTIIIIIPTQNKHIIKTNHFYCTYLYDYTNSKLYYFLNYDHVVLFYEYTKWLIVCFIITLNYVYTKQFKLLIKPLNKTGVILNCIHYK